MCLLGAFCSGRDASGMRVVDGTSDAYLGGEAIQLVLLDFATLVELAMSADVN